MIPHIIQHPVMGWYIIILLATIVLVPPVYLIGERAALAVSMGGQVLALLWGLGNMAWDIARRR